MQKPARLPARTHLQDQKRRRDAEADGIAEAVQLPAELAGRLRKTGDGTIENIEDHRQDDEPAGHHEGIIDRTRFFARHDLAGHRDGDEPADAVAQSQQRRHHRDPFHGIPLIESGTIASLLDR